MTTQNILVKDKEDNLEDLLVSLIGEDILINQIKIYKKSKLVEIVIKSEVKNIQVEEVQQKLFKIYNWNFNIKTINEHLSKELEVDIIAIAKNIIKQRIPNIDKWQNFIKYNLKDTKLDIIVTNEFIYEIFESRNIRDNLKLDLGQLSEKNYFVNIDFEKSADSNGAINNNTVISQLITEISKNNEKIEKKEKIPSVTATNSTVLIGKEIKDNLVEITSVTTESGKVAVKGKIMEWEEKEIKGGKFVFSIEITDNVSSILVKTIIKPDQAEILRGYLKEGHCISVRGDSQFDTFKRELIIFANDISQSNYHERNDEEIEKRVELHAHTQLSSMDGVCSPSDLVRSAAKWGHKAIAITDHGVVQAFPEAAEAAKKHKIKVIYGVEAYLVNDGEKTIDIKKSYSIEDEIVVFDIETTGLSNIYDDIIEIGAVKIKNGNIIETFSQLIKPQKSISVEITKLTGIDNEMVSESPTIDTVLPQFLAFIEGCLLAAHNAKFDIGFIKSHCEKLRLNFNNDYIDTLSISRILFKDLKNYKLNTICKFLNISLENHHRACDDAKAAGEVLNFSLKILKEKGGKIIEDFNNICSSNVDTSKLPAHHIIILAKNYEGLRNLYKLISFSHLEYFHRTPRIPKSLLQSHREGLILGTACEAGQLYNAILDNASEDELNKIISFYDYLEVQPLSNNRFLIEKGRVKDTNDLIEINKRIIALGRKYNKLVVATCDVHYVEPHQDIYRRIILCGKGFEDGDKPSQLYLRTTREMLDEFSYLDNETAREIVIGNPNKIEQEIEDIIPIPDDTFPPKIDGAENILREICMERATELYGTPLPDVVEKRLNRELNSIISNGYAVMYVIAQKLVWKSLEDGYLVGSRGSVGSSFAATMSGITEVNPLPPHYVCGGCKNSEFILDGSIGSGFDLEEKNCPKCGQVFIKDGHDIPFEVFLGFEGDKEPDIDLNFAGEYQAEAHKYTEELFGKGKVFRAGTIGTLADKTAYGFVKKYLEERSIAASNTEIKRLIKGCTGIKRTTGQHPGGVMIVPSDKEIYEFTPIQHPADSANTDIITTHFDYHSISGRLLKLDILGHDVPTIIKMLEDITKTNATKIPLDDSATISLFTSTEALNVSQKDINCPVGTLGIPEFGTKFVRQMLVDTQPSTFGELVRISGLSHGTDVWINNAQELVKNNVAKLKDVISTRDDIMLYLIYSGVNPKTSFKIMEKVRKGKGLSPEDEEDMAKNNVPKWYIESCNKIKYMFPKAHAAAYVMMSFRIAYYKVHYPEAFYATYFTTKADDFDAQLICNGHEEVQRKISDLESRLNELTTKEKNMLTVLEVVNEAYHRKINFKKVDLYKSNATKFVVDEDGLLPPLIGLQGLGISAAKNIQEARDDGEFISIEDLVVRTKISKTVVEILIEHGCINNMPKTSQLSLF